MAELALVSVVLDEVDNKMKTLPSFSSKYVKEKGAVFQVGTKYLAILENLLAATSTKSFDKDKLAAYSSIAELLADIIELLHTMPEELPKADADFIDVIQKHLMNIRQVTQAAQEHQKKLAAGDIRASKLHLKDVLALYVDERTMFKVFLLIFQVKRVLQVQSPKARRVAKKG